MDLKVTLPDEVVERVALALGSTDGPGKRTPATNEQITAALTNFLKGALIEYETAEMARAKRKELSESEKW